MKFDWHAITEWLNADGLMNTAQGYVNNYDWTVAEVKRLGNTGEYRLVARTLMGREKKVDRYSDDQNQVRIEKLLKEKIRVDETYENRMHKKGWLLSE